MLHFLEIEMVRKMRIIILKKYANNCLQGCLERFTKTKVVYEVEEAKGYSY